MKRDIPRPTNAQRAIKTIRERKAAGLCVECGIPAVDGWRCEPHKLRTAVRCRNRYRLKHGIPLDAPDQRKSNP